MPPYSPAWNSYSNFTKTDLAELLVEVLVLYKHGISYENMPAKLKAGSGIIHSLERERDRYERALVKEEERKRKLAEKKAIEDAKRAEVASKLTAEELVALGLDATGQRIIARRK